MDLRLGRSRRSSRCRFRTEGLNLTDNVLAVRRGYRLTNGLAGFLSARLGHVRKAGEPARPPKDLSPLQSVWFRASRGARANVQPNGDRGLKGRGFVVVFQPIVQAFQKCLGTLPDQLTPKRDIFFWQVSYADCAIHFPKIG
jgi:hypothetical protein